MQQIFRKEYKYVIAEEVYLKLQRMLEAVMQVDEHSLYGDYMVRSQYYDSLTDADLCDNLSGVCDKRKIRIRIYSTNDLVAKLECKCKNAADGIKYSLALTKEEVKMMEAHNYEFLLERKEQLALSLYTKMTQQLYRPKTIVQYDRMAYIYPASDVRITFDRNIRATVNPYGIYDDDLNYAPLMEDGFGVLEIKFNDFLPSFLKPFVDRIDCVAQAYSKYSKSRVMYS